MVFHDHSFKFVCPVHVIHAVSIECARVEWRCRRKRLQHTHTCTQPCAECSKPAAYTPTAVTNGAKQSTVTCNSACEYEKPTPAPPLRPESSGLRCLRPYGQPSGSAERSRRSAKAASPRRGHDSGASSAPQQRAENRGGGGGEKRRGRRARPETVVLRLPSPGRAWAAAR